MSRIRPGRSLGSGIHFVAYQRRSSRLARESILRRHPHNPRLLPASLSDGSKGSKQECASIIAENFTILKESCPIRKAELSTSRSRLVSGLTRVDFGEHTIVCLASGPSLSLEDVEVIAQSGLFTIAVNRTYEIAPFARIIYAGDDRWWSNYHDKTPDNMDKWTCARHSASKYGLNLHVAIGPYNSGLRALQLAVDGGAKRVILLGYDCQHTGGQAHWHEPYVGLGNAVSVKKWPGQFSHYAKQVKSKVEIVNCTRETALTCFVRKSLTEALCHPVHIG